MNFNTKKINALTLLIGFSQIYAWATTYYLPATLIDIIPVETGHGSLSIYLIESIGWRNMVIVYSIPHFVLWAPLFYFYFPKTVPLHQDIHDEKTLVVSEKIKIIFYLLAIYAILRSVVGTSISIDVLTLFSGLGLTLGAAAMSASLIGPSQIAGRLIEMYLGRHVDPIHSSIFWTAVLPISIFGLIAYGASAASVFSIAYGMSNGVLTITMGVLPMILFGSRGYATLLGKLALPVLIAQAATPLLFDPLIKNWPSVNLFIFLGTLGAASLLCLIYLSFLARGRG